MSTPNALPAVAYFIPKADQFCLPAEDGTRPFAKQWEPLCKVSDALAAIAAASAAMQPLSCVWTEQDDDAMPGTYASACGEMWSFNDGGATENNVRFCQGCGKPVEVKAAANISADGGE